MVMLEVCRGRRRRGTIYAVLGSVHYTWYTSRQSTSVGFARRREGGQSNAGSRPRGKLGRAAGICMKRKSGNRQRPGPGLNPECKRKSRIVRDTIPLSASITANVFVLPPPKCHVEVTSTTIAGLHQSQAASVDPPKPPLPREAATMSLRLPPKTWIN